VNALYDVRTDHRRFVAAPQNLREIRVHYPLRLEFWRATVAPPPNRPKLAVALAGLGFNVEARS
jgi:hypothetical protein